jgi:WD40 repeat protein
VSPQRADEPLVTKAVPEVEPSEKPQKVSPIQPRKMRRLTNRLIVFLLVGIFAIVGYTVIFQDDPQQQEDTKPRPADPSGQPAEVAQPDPAINHLAPLAKTNDKPRIKPGAIRTLRGHEGIVWRLAFSPDGKHLISGSNSHYQVINKDNPGFANNHPGNDNTIRIWEVESGQELVKIGGHTWEVTGLAYCPMKDTELFAACSSTERYIPKKSYPTVAVYRAGANLHTFYLPQGPAMRGIALSADATKVFACQSDGRLVSWDLKTQAELPTVKLSAFGVDKWENVLWCVDFSADRSRLYGGLGTGEIVCWATSTGERLKGFYCLPHLDPGPEGDGKRVVSIALSPDEKRLVSSSTDNTIRLWDLETGEEERKLIGHEKAVGYGGLEKRKAACVAFSPDGKRIISGGIDSTLRVWDVATGDQLALFQGHIGGILAVAISPDGHMAATGGIDKTIRLWQLP